MGRPELEFESGLPMKMRRFIGEGDGTDSRDSHSLRLKVGVYVLGLLKPIKKLLQVYYLRFLQLKSSETINSRC